MGNRAVLTRRRSFLHDAAMRRALFPLLALIARGPAVHSADLDALALLDARRAELLSAPAPGTPAQRATMAQELLDAGLLERASVMLDAAARDTTGELDGLAVQFRLDLAAARFAEAVSLREALGTRAAQSPDAATAHGRLLLLIEDLPSLDAWLKHRAESDPARLLLAADLAWKTNHHDEAEALYRRALESGGPARDALLGLGNCALRANRTDEALGHATRALTKTGPSAGSLDFWASALLRAGRASEAVPVFERVAKDWPADETAHYQLGNGSSRRNYTELERDSPRAFPTDAAFREPLAVARRRLLRKDLAALGAAWPAACEPEAVLASLTWNDGDLVAAEAHARESLKREPLYGRAHAILAKTLESKRLLVSVRRPEDESLFARTPLPKIPGIETFVTNWSSLSRRHQKRVAISLSPFAAFVPVLIEGGQTFTIKLLHERLSETPMHETLRDERIVYDSRLWDDVRGCGGNDTVTGIEDVERTIFRGYDTVLHEFSHQVHHVLTEDETTRIEKTYAAATRAEAGGKETFLSRYQASSVWEYFAEGVHASCTKPVGDWDTRDMRLDRLKALDPALLELARRYTSMKDTSRFVPTALTSRAWRDVEHHDLISARKALDRALMLAPQDEVVAAASITVRLYEGDATRANEEARAALALHPASAGIASAAADAEVHATGDRARARSILEEAAKAVDAARKKDVQVGAAWLAIEEGVPSEAAVALRAVLAEHADDEDALHALVNALAFLPGADATETRDVLTRCVRKRAGSKWVRADASIAFARLGDLAAARDQVREGLLNAPDSDLVHAASAYVEWKAGARTEALAAAVKAADLAADGDSTYNDIAALVGALAGDASSCHRCARRAEALRTGAPGLPRYIWVERDHGFRSVNRGGPLERELLQELAQPSG